VQTSLERAEAFCNRSDYIIEANMKLCIIIWCWHQNLDHQLISDISRAPDSMAEYQNEQTMEDYPEEKTIMHDMDHNYSARGNVSVIASRRLMVGLVLKSHDCTEYT